MYGERVRRLAGLSAATTALALVVAPAAHAAAAPTSIPPHVMVLMMENQSVPDVIGTSDAPYQTQLSQSYEFASQSYGIGHESLDNYLGLISGNWYAWSDGDCSPGSGCRAPASDSTLANQFDAAGIPWRGYMGSMTSNAETHDDEGNGNEYGVRHDPFVYFPSLSGDANDILPAGTSANWDSDTNLLNGLNAATPPDFVFLSPSMCQNGGGDSAPNCSKGATIAAGDKFLSTMIPAIQATTWYQQGGTIILTYDEGDGGGQGESTHSAGNHVPTTIISAATKGAANFTSYVNQWGVLGGIENAYGLSYLGNAADPAGNGRLPLKAGNQGNTVTVTDPGAQSGTVGSPVNLAIKATDSSTGTALSYQASGLPAGLVIDAVTGVISGTPTSTGSSAVTVTARDSTGASGSAQFGWTVNPTGTTCTPAQLLGDPGFENGATLAPWTQTSTTGQQPINNDTADQPAHSGKWDAWLNGDGAADTDTVSQTVALPAGCATATLSYYLHVDTKERSGGPAEDTLTAQVADGSGNPPATVASYSSLNAGSGYTQHVVDLSGYAGKTVTVRFTGTETDANGGTTDFVIDDTALNVW